MLLPLTVGRTVRMFLPRPVKRVFNFYFVFHLFSSIVQIKIKMEKFKLKHELNYGGYIFRNFVVGVGGGASAIAD